MHARFTLRSNLGDRVLEVEVLIDNQMIERVTTDDAAMYEDAKINVKE